MYELFVAAHESENYAIERENNAEPMITPFENWIGCCLLCRRTIVPICSRVFIQNLFLIPANGSYHRSQFIFIF